VRDILLNGEQRTDRTGTGTIALFGKQMRFDISQSIPILTTKKMYWKSCIIELLWFLRGDTDITFLKENGVNIWNGNTTREYLDANGLQHIPERNIGKGYGFQWRRFGGEEDGGGGFDQIKHIIHLLKTQPNSRRIFMSSWNPAQMRDMALPPCHVSAQFYVDNNRRLSCHMYQRSVDCFLGLPFNILSYAVLTYVLATICDMTPYELIISTGDTHIYNNHLEQIQEQLERIPFSPPTLRVNPDIKYKEIEDITIEDFEVIGYCHHPPLKAKMAV
jgi:thymidylate synthase